jgi:lipopolysaccharide transport system ATP-binding protein
MAAILTLGAGFHPDLSGNENIRIGCAVLGLSPAETSALLPAIVKFSELGAFVDRPVRTYSTGMYLRLGFSVATAVDPNILVIDEHLSVGDQHFRLKCKRRIMDLREGGCTIVFCSHDLYSVKEICDQTLWLRDGRTAMLGETEAVLNAYQNHVRIRDVQTDTLGREKRPHATTNCLREVVLGGDCHDGQVESGARLELRLKAHVTEDARREGVKIAVLIVRSDALHCYGAFTKIDPPEAAHRPGDDEYGVTFVIDRLPLLTGLYSFTVALQDLQSPHTYDFQIGACPFSVRHEGTDRGVMRIEHHWDPL